MLSSLGLFYAILIALFAIPLVGTCVVILIKGVLDLRYLILAGGGMALAILGVFAFKAIKRLWCRFKQDGSNAVEMLRQHQIMGQTVEISFLGGLLKFKTGQPQSTGNPPIPHYHPSLLPHCTGRDDAADIVYQLQGLRELKHAGTISADEFDLLKAVLIEGSASTGAGPHKNPCSRQAH